MNPNRTTLIVLTMNLGALASLPARQSTRNTPAGMARRFRGKMRDCFRGILTLTALVASLTPSPCDAASLNLPTVPGMEVVPYATVTDPISLSFAPDGTLYTGRDNSGSGGLSSDALKINRAGPCGSPVTEFGNVTIRDPDAVLFDAAGIVSGLPGSVIGGGLVAGVNGQISRCFYRLHKP